MPIDIYLYINLIMKLRITENQYKRIFLTEQYTAEDGTFYGAHNVDNYKKNQSGFDKDSYDRYKAQEFNRLTQQLAYSTPEGAYKRAQGQWALWGAPNSKTGHNLIPDEILEKLIPPGQSLEDHPYNYDNEVDDFPIADYNPSIPVDTETGGLSTYIKQNNYYKQLSQSDYNMNQQELWKNYIMAQDWNRTIRDQKNLISQYCTKTSDKQWIIQYYGSDNEGAKRARQQQAKIGSPGPQNKVYYGKPKDNRYTSRGWYHVYYQDISESPWTFCGNPTEKGVFVYNTQAGHMCGCINETSHNDGYLTQHGNFSKQDLLGWTKQFKDYKKENAPGFFEGVVDYLGKCTEDYHCVLDLLSIAALAIPVYGVAISFGLDAINATAYGVEAFNAETGAERTAAIFAGILTLGGGMAGGGMKSMNNIRKASANPKIYKYMGEVVDKTKKEFGAVKNLKSIKDKNKLTKIYADAANKFKMTDSEILMAHDLIKTFNKIEPDLLKTYTKYLEKAENTVRKKHSFSLQEIFKNKDWQDALKANNGDVLVTLNKYLKRPLYKEFLIQIGAFVGVQEILQLPEVQEWVGLIYREGKYKLHPSIKNRVEVEGYDWNQTKQIFGSILNTDPNFTMEKSRDDNILLTKAWKSGWRPYDKKFIQNKQQPTMNDFNKVPAEFQTDTYKKRYELKSDYKKDTIYKHKSDEKSTDEKEDGKRVVYIPDNIDVEVMNAPNPPGEEGIDNFLEKYKVP